MEEVTEEQIVEQVSFSYDGQTLYVVDDIPDYIIPTDFFARPITIGEKDVLGLDFIKGDLQLLYLVNESEQSKLYIYDAKSETVYPFIKRASGDNYIIFVTPDEQTVIPTEFLPCTLDIDGKNIIPAYQYDMSIDMDEYMEEILLNMYFLYTINQNGEYYWYEFDATTEVFQPYVSDVYQMDVESVEENDDGIIETIGAIPQSESEYDEDVYALEQQQRLLAMIVVLALTGVVIVAILVYFNFYKANMNKKRKNAKHNKQRHRDE